MNHHPVHLDVNYSKKAKHKKILVNGLLVISVVVGMTVRDISGKAIANLGYDNVIHQQPTFINDTLYAETEIISKIEKNNDTGIVNLKTVAINQNDITVLSLKRSILVPKK